MKLARLFSIDLRSLALVRIGVALYILLDLARRAPLIGAQFTDAGIIPREFFAPWIHFFSLYFLGGSYPFALFLFLLTAASALALALGFRTRIATVLCYLLVTSLHVRGWQTLQGGDDFIRAALLWSLFLPWAARFSLDARRCAAALQPSAPPGPPVAVLSAASFALLAQFAFVYATGGFTKSGPDWHSTGNAISMVLAQDYWIRPGGVYLRQFPELLRVLTHTILWFEILGPFLLFLPVFTLPVRLFALAGFLFFELSLSLCLQLDLFPFAMAAGALAFIPTAFWNRLENKKTRAANPGSESILHHSEAETESPDTARITRAPLIQNAAVTLLLVVLAFTTAARFVTPAKSASFPVPHFLGLVPGWDVYTIPPSRNSWFEVMARLRDGSVQRLLRIPASAPPSPGSNQESLAASPSPIASGRVARLHRHFRIKQYLMRLSRPGIPSDFLDLYLAWLCREIGGELPGALRPELLQFIEINTPVLLPPNPQPYLVREYTCPPSG